MAHTAVLLLIATLAMASAMPKTLNMGVVGGDNKRNLQQVPQLTQRVVFDPNAGEDNKIEKYFGNVYIGEVALSEADPVAAAAGGAVNAGLQFTYDKRSYFDDETFAARASIGPGAKAVGAAVARLLGIASAKAAGAGVASANLAYKRDAAKENSVTVGTVNQIGAGLSGGVYLDRSSDDDTPLLELPKVNFAFGK